jgi:D-alanyl-D-alanine carboxypeptidase
MAYLTGEDRDEIPRGLGCGPSCKCDSCRSGHFGLGQTYFRDEDESQPDPGPGTAGLGANWRGNTYDYVPMGFPGSYARHREEFAGFGLGAGVAVDDPVTHRHCETSEHRIHPILEPPANELVEVDRRYLANPGSRAKLLGLTYRAYVALKQAAEQDGLPPRILTIVSAYRSVRRQQELWERAVKRYGSERAAVTWVARPGHSAHNTGRAIDFYLGTSNDSRNIAALRATPAYRWLVCNAGRFGFTPYAAEPWHWEHHPSGSSPFVAPPQPAIVNRRRGNAGRPAPASSTSMAGPPGPGPRTRPSSVAPPPASFSGGLPGFSPTEEKALRITTTFETGRPLGFSGLTGNFDGQGISFGLLQWNFGTGSLQPLLRQFDQRFPTRFNAIFGNDAPRLRDVLDSHTIAEQMQFARSINDAQNHIVEPWNSRFNRLAQDPDFQAIQLAVARRRMDAAEQNARELGLHTERSLAVMFDNVTQNGAAWLDVPRQNPRRRILQDRKSQREHALRRPLNERELLELIANVVADTANPRWREDVRRRRMTIVNGTGVVHGTHFDLGTRFGLSDQPWTAGGAAAQQPAPRRVPGPVLQNVRRGAVQAAAAH